MSAHLKRFSIAALIFGVLASCVSMWPEVTLKIVGFILVGSLVILWLWTLTGVDDGGGM